MWKESKWVDVLYVIQVKLLSAKNRLLYLEGISCKPGGKHKAKTYSRYKKDKAENQSLLLQKIINSQRKAAKEGEANSQETI